MKKYNRIESTDQIMFTPDGQVVIRDCAPSDGGPPETLTLAKLRIPDEKTCAKAARFLVKMTAKGFTAEPAKAEPGTVFLYEPGTEFMTIGPLNDFIANPITIPT
jgi:hypothetical protein